MIGLGGKQRLLCCLSLVILSCGNAQLFFDPIDGLGLVPPPRLRDDLGNPYLLEPGFLTHDRARSSRAARATSSGPAPADAAAPTAVEDASSPGPAAAPAPGPMPADVNASSAEGLADQLLQDPFEALLQPTPPPPAAHRQQPPAPAPGAKAGNGSAQHAQPTQIKDLLAPSPPSPAVPSPTTAQGPPAADPPADPAPAPAHAGLGGPDAAHSDRGRDCAAQGMAGECNQCVCCCTPAGGGGFVSYVPDACDCRKQLNREDVALALVLGAIALIPTLLVSCYLGELLPLSPYKPQQQALPTTAAVPAPAAVGA